MRKWVFVVFIGYRFVSALNSRSWSSYTNVSIHKLPTIWAISFHFATQRMPLAHHMTVHFFPFQELGHVRQIMHFKSLVHVCGILFQPTWDRPNHWTFSRVNLKLTCSINGFAYVLLVYYLFCFLFVFAFILVFLFSAVMFARALYKCRVVLYCIVLYCLNCNTEQANHLRLVWKLICYWKFC